MQRNIKKAIYSEMMKKIYKPIFDDILYYIFYNINEVILSTKNIEILDAQKLSTTIPMYVINNKLKNYCFIKD